MLKTKSLLSVFIISCILLSISSIAKSETFDLDMTTGDRFTHVIESEEVAVMNSFGSITNTSQRYTLYLSARVHERSPGNQYLIKYTIQRIIYNISTPMISLNYDTDLEVSDKDKNGRLFGLLTGQTFSVELDSKGRVRKITGINEAFVSAFDTLEIPVKSRGMMLELFSPVIGEKALSEKLSRPTSISDHPEIQEGAKWSSKEQTLLPYPMETEVTYKVSSLSKEIAEVKFQGVITTHPTRKETVINGAQARVEISGEEEGTASLDLDRGIVKTWERESDFFVVSKMMIGSDPIEIPMDIKWKSQSRITDYMPAKGLE